MTTSRAKTSTLIETRDLSTFARVNYNLLLSWISNRIHVRDLSTLQDYFQHYMLIMHRQRLLDKFDSRASAYKTFISMTLHSAITDYQLKTKIKCYRDNQRVYNEAYNTVDIDSESCRSIGMDSEDIADIEARYDIYKFFSWYKRKKNLQVWKTDTDIEIIKRTLLGESQTEIAGALHITPQAVYFSLRKVKALYKAWLKEVSLEPQQKSLQ